MTTITEKPSALVTGAHGHSGSFLVKTLIERGWQVTATDLPSGKRSKLITKERVLVNHNNGDPIYRLDEGAGMRFIPADLTVKSSISRVFKGKRYKAIFHTASLYDYFAEYDVLKRVNVEGLANLLEIYMEYCSERGLSKSEFPRFLHWSTCGVYGEPTYKKWNQPCTESCPYNPPNDYSKTKVAQERMLHAWQEKHDIPVIILRPAPIYGPRQSYGAFHLFYIVNKVGYIPIIHIYPRKKRLRMPMVHVEDLTNAAIFLAEYQDDKILGEAYNIVDDCPYQEDFEEALAEIMDVDYHYMPMLWCIYKPLARLAFKLAVRQGKHFSKRGKRPPVDPPMVEYATHQYYFSNEKIRSLGFKFKYRHGFEGIRETARWYFIHGWLENENDGPITKT
ncbi:NAD-dependent epimerase/dehydratase family protein [Candidatus Bathyarchaeota archaeon]|nr:NAD-dependent epimerase/dehydratase family protein [Candidatus Bathyarchaeota archaeon]